MRHARVIVAATLVAAACGGGDGEDGTAGAGSVQGERAAADDAPTADSRFPGDEWSTADPEELGFDPQELESIAAGARRDGTACLLVSRQGQIAAEWYWDDTDESTAHEAFSATKSYTSALVGIAQEDGDLDIDDTASEYVPDWAGTPSEDVTIRNILSGDSGLQVPAGFDVINAEDATNYAIALDQDAEPGTTWQNNEPAIQVLETVLAGATGDEPADFAEERLFGPIGADETTMGRDPSGNTYMFWNMHTTCRDAARFGYLFLRHGNWDGQQVVPEEWVAESTASSQDLNRGYGYLWWLGDSGNPDEMWDELAPDAPEDMYWALGAFGQIIQVDPGSETVVVRFGTSDAVYNLSAIQWTTRLVTEALDS